MARTRKDQRLLTIHGPYANRHPDAAQVAYAGGIRLIHNGILRGDADAAEGIYDLLEATEVNHDGVVNADAIKLAEHFAECGCGAVWKRVAVRLRRTVIGVDLVVIG